MKTIQIPQQNSGDRVAFEFEKNMVIVGANGAGKTRFGSQLEQINNPTKRISAQRYLELSEVVQKQDFESAETQLRGSYKNTNPIQPQNDYQQVLVSLFAQESQRDSEYVANARASESKLEIPHSVKEAVVSVWSFIFPYRTLKLDRDRVRASNDAEEFSGTEMSDGEKVGLYLISQIFLAEKDCILIIDEPELHLHKALMVRLWNKLEEERKDCTFIYITHDLDFAVSKPASKLLWIQSYKNGQWDWQELSPNEIIPENLYLEVLGSRESILFVEGEKGSLDIQIYQAVYENFTVIPRGSCEKVIESVKGLKNNASMHDKKVFGLIDRDFRPTEQIESLKNDGIFSTHLNKIENLFLLPDIIQIVCEHLSKKDKKEEILLQVKEIYKTNKEPLAFRVSKYQIQRVFNERFDTLKSNADYETFKTTVFSETDRQFVALPETNDIIEILKVYPHKGLVKQIQGALELAGNGYKNLVLSFLATNKRGGVLSAVKPYLPEINE